MLLFQGYFDHSIIFSPSRQFGELSLDTEEKRKYSLFKVVDIRKALKAIFLAFSQPQQNSLRNNHFNCRRAESLFQDQGKNKKRQNYKVWI